MADDHDKEFRELRMFMLAAYGLLAELLGGLPLPIRLPELDDNWEPVDAVQAIDRARTELIKAQPIDTTTQVMIERALLEWLTVYELGAVIAIAGESSWRLDGIDYGLHRLVIIAGEAGRRLGIDLHIEDEQ